MKQNRGILSSHKSPWKCWNAFLKIVCFTKNIYLLNEVLCILAGQGARCQSLRFEKNLTFWVNLRLILLSDECALYACLVTNFIRSQTLASGNFAIPWDAWEDSCSFEKPIFFLKHTIFRKCVAALLRWFMWAQSTPIFLCKMAFQWLLLTVRNLKIL